MNDLFLILSEEILFTMTLNEKSFSILFDDVDFYLDTRVDNVRRKQRINMEQLEHIYNNVNVRAIITADFTNLQAQKLKFAKGKDLTYKLISGMLSVDDKHFHKITKIIDLISQGYTYQLTDDSTIFFTGKYRWANDYLNDSMLRVSKKQVDELGNETLVYLPFSQVDIINLISKTIDDNPTEFDKRLVDTETKVLRQENFKKNRYNELVNYNEKKRLASEKEQKRNAKKWLLSIREKLVSQKNITKEIQKSNDVDLVEYFDSISAQEEDENILLR